MLNIFIGGRFSGSLKISLCEVRRLKEIQNFPIFHLKRLKLLNVKTEDFKLVKFWKLKIWELSRKIKDLNSEARITGKTPPCDLPTSLLAGRSEAIQYV